MQAYFHAPTYLAPLLVGIRSGAAMAYAMLGASAARHLCRRIDARLLPALELWKSRCAGAPASIFTPAGGGSRLNLLPVKDLGNPWVSLQDDMSGTLPGKRARDLHRADSSGRAMARLPDAGRDFAVPAAGCRSSPAAFEQLAARNARRTYRAPAILPSRVRRSCRWSRSRHSPASPPSDAFAIIMSGDGGWAGLDQDVAAALSAKGIPVVGLDSLRYYWTARTPDGVAADTDKLIRYYLAHFGRNACC